MELLFVLISMTVSSSSRRMDSELWTHGPLVTLLCTLIMKGPVEFEPLARHHRLAYGRAHGTSQVWDPSTLRPVVRGPS